MKVPDYILFISASNAFNSLSNSASVTCVKEGKLIRSSCIWNEIKSPIFEDTLRAAQHTKPSTLLSSSPSNNNPVTFSTGDNIWLLPRAKSIKGIPLTIEKTIQTENEKPIYTAKCKDLVLVVKIYNKWTGRKENPGGIHLGSFVLKTDEGDCTKRN